MSSGVLGAMRRFFGIVFCLLSVFTICLLEDSEFSSEIAQQGGAGLYVSMLLALLAVCYLQYQLYNYLVPRKLRSLSSNDQEGHYSNSFFKGTISTGYLFVVLHLGMIYFSANSEHEVEGFMYIGSALIVLGTLSKIKGVIGANFGG